MGIGRNLMSRPADQLVGLDGGGLVLAKSCRPHPVPLPQERVPRSPALAQFGAAFALACPSASPFSIAAEGDSLSLRDPSLEFRVHVVGIARQTA